MTEAEIFQVDAVLGHENGQDLLQLGFVFLGGELRDGLGVHEESEYLSGHLGIGKAQVDDALQE